MSKLLDLLCPRNCAPSIDQVDLDALQKRGIRGIILDLDNTLLPWKDSTVPPSTAEWVKRAIDKGMKLCIASNTHNPRRLQAIALSLGISSLYGINKPSRRGLRKAMVEIGSDQSNTALIGDQIFTDILGGNRLSLYTILVKPMHRREFIGTKFTRLIERIALAWLRKRGMLGTKEPAGESEV